MNSRWCSVPQCTNTSIKNPEKVFIHVPVKPEIRQKWLKLAGKNADHLSPQSKLHFCGDHFDLEKDMTNYMEFSMNKSVKRIRLREGCLPAKFDCQADGGKETSTENKPAVTKGRKPAASRESDTILEEYTNNGEKEHGSSGEEAFQMEAEQKKKRRGEGWEEENMSQALQAVIDGVPVQRVSQDFNIPRRTLRNHILSGTATKKLGCPPALTALQESRLCKRLMDVGATFTPQVLMRSVVTFSNELKIPHRFQFGIASRKWLKGFLSRHPEILVRNENDTSQTKSNKKREIAQESSSPNESSKNNSASTSSEQNPPSPAIKVELPADVVLNPTLVPPVAESTSTEYAIMGKRFVNVEFLIKSLQKLNDHGVDGCNLSDMAICGETKEGWNIGVMLSCRVCFTSAVVWMEDPETKLVKVRPKVPQTPALPEKAQFLQAPIFAERAPLKQRRRHRTPTPPPEPPVRFLMPLPLARSVFLPRATDTEVATKTQPQATNPSPVQPAPFIKQEIILPDDGSGPSTNPSPSTQPTSVQLIFYVDQPEGSQQPKSSTATSSFEDITVTPDVYVGGQTSSATCSTTSTAAEEVAVTHDVYPVDVLPVDLNLVKREVEDELLSGHQDGPGVCLVPMSETSLDPSRTLFASEDLESTNLMEIQKVSTAEDPIKGSRTSGTTDTIAATVSGTVASNDPSVYSMATSKSACPKYSRLISKENAKSLIWKHFGLPADESGHVVDNSIKICKICMRPVSSKGASTTNMITHLAVHHAFQYKDMFKRLKRCVPSRTYDTNSPDRSSPIEYEQAEYSTPNPKEQTVSSNRPKFSRLIVKETAKSVIWKHFGLPVDESGRRVDIGFSVCKICMKRVGSKRGTTTNMFCHLKRYHPSKYKNALKESKQCLPLRYPSNRIEIGDAVHSGSITNVQDMEESLKVAVPSTFQNTETILLNSQLLHANSSASPIMFSKLIDKEKAKSVIWKHFGLPVDESGRRVDIGFSVCKICMKRVGSKRGTTTNMFCHLKRYHPSKYKNALEESKQCLPLTYPSNRIGFGDAEHSGSITNVQDTEESLKDAKLPIHKNTTLLKCRLLDSNSSENYIESITKFLAFTLQPYNLVELKPFIDMIRNINPSCKIPSRKYFSKTGIPKLYNDTLAKLKQDMATVEFKDISMTTECWTSVTKTPYIAVTIHFIDHQWNLKSACIKCAYLDINHTYSNICDTLTSALSDWGLDVANVTGCTADDGSNISKAISHLQLPYISCFGHYLNVGVNRALGIDRLEQAMSKLKKLQSVISQSCKMKRDLAKSQKSLQMDVVVLPCACPTRWGSTPKLIKRFLSNQLPIRKMFEDHPDQSHLLPNASDVSAMEDFISNTKLIEEITTTILGEEHIPAPSVLPLYRKIKKCLQCQDSDNALSKQIKSEIVSTLSERYEDESLKTILSMSSLCDPRFRLNFTDDTDDVKAIALQEMSRVYETIHSLSAADSDVEKKGLEKLFDVEENTSRNDSMPDNKARAELDKYLTMPKVNMNVNPLTWWKSNADSFPVLKTLARKYLAVQGSRVSSERMFSAKGYVMARQRMVLPPKLTEMQIFLAENQNT